jgi:4a-hydroxytetrahydrobiopterin dehydratase
VNEREDPKQLLKFPDVEAEGLRDWRLLYDTLHARFRTGNFVTGLELVNRIGAAAEQANHHPDIDLSYPRVEVRLTSHDVGGVTSRDIRLARRISGLAAELGVEATPGEVAAMELGLDTPAHDEIKPFWTAMLGYTTTKLPDEIRDPAGKRPTLWFQEAPTARGEVQQRFHLDITVPLDVAEDRVAAALEAGGTLVSDEAAPSFWVLADAHGNRSCICTSEGR